MYPKLCKLYEYMNYYIKVKHINFNKIDINLFFLKYDFNFEYLKTMFIRDILITEQLLTIDNDKVEDIIINYIENNKIIDEVNSKDKLIIENLMKTINKYENYEFTVISEDLIKDVNRSLMTGLNHNESYRKIDVKPNLTDNRYSSFYVIENEMKTLIHWFNLTICYNFNELMMKIILFYSMFLLIHPFIDGNGRTIRIIANLMLKESLYIYLSISNEFYKDEYIRILDIRHDMLTDNKLIHNLINYIHKMINKYTLL